MEEIFLGNYSLPNVFSIPGQLDYSVFAFPHSDIGVGKSFFKEVCGNQKLDLLFGTGGLIKHFYPQNIQRVSLEKPMIPAELIVKYELVRQSYKRIKT